MVVAVTWASHTASAHASVGVFFGGPVYAAPPPVYYQPYAPPVIYQSYPPPVVYQSPPVVYGPPPVPYYGYGYRGEDWDHRGWHDNGCRRGGGNPPHGAYAGYLMCEPR